MGYEKCPKLISKGEDGKMFYGAVEILKIDLEDGYEVSCTICETVVTVAEAKRQRCNPYRLMAQHIDVAHNEIYKCEVCGRKYSGPRNLESHFLYTHTANPPKVECDICGKPLQTAKVIDELLKSFRVQVHTANQNFFRSSRSINGLIEVRKRKQPPLLLVKGRP